MAKLFLRLQVSAAELQRFYAGHAKEVLAQAESGERVSFPAEHLRSFVDENGVHGRFALEFDEAQRFVALTRVAETDVR